MAMQNIHAMFEQVHDCKAPIAAHSRCRDFQQIEWPDDIRGCFNGALPLTWYLATCASIKRACGDEAQFLRLTDAIPHEMQPFIDAFAPLTTFHLRLSACSDLLLMAFADSVVCAVSSYRIWCTFLSNAPLLPGQFCEKVLTTKRGRAVEQDLIF